MWISTVSSNLARLNLLEQGDRLLEGHSPFLGDFLRHVLELIAQLLPRAARPPRCAFFLASADAAAGAEGLGVSALAPSAGALWPRLALSAAGFSLGARLLALFGVGFLFLGRDRFLAFFPGRGGWSGVGGFRRLFLGHGVDSGKDKNASANRNLPRLITLCQTGSRSPVFRCLGIFFLCINFRHTHKRPPYYQPSTVKPMLGRAFDDAHRVLFIAGIEVTNFRLAISLDLARDTLKPLYLPVPCSFPSGGSNSLGFLLLDRQTRRLLEEDGRRRALDDEREAASR